MEGIRSTLSSKPLTPDQLPSYRSTIGKSFIGRGRGEAAKFPLGLGCATFISNARVGILVPPSSRSPLIHPLSPKAFRLIL